MNKKGIVIVLAGVIVYSMDTLLIQLSGTTGFIAGFWRGFYAFITLFILFWFQNRKSFLYVMKKDIKPMISSGFLWGISGILYATAIKHVGTSTSVILLSTNILFATFFGAILLKEKVRTITVICILIAMSGIFIMNYRDFNIDNNLIGNICALLTPACIGLNYANMRRYPQVSRLGISLFGSMFAVSIGFIGSGFNTQLPYESKKYLMILGVIVLPFGQYMISTGTKYLKASETALIASLESVFGLLYVWLFTGTTPSKNHLFGGVIVFLAIIINIFTTSTTSTTQSGKLT